MSTSKLQRWLSSQQGISDQYETEIHPEDINCMGVSSDINEESFKSLCVQCKKNHLKKMISQLYTDITKQVYKLALCALNSGQSKKVAGRGYIKISKGSLSKVVFMTIYLKDKPSIENIQSFLSAKVKVLFEKLAELFNQFKIIEKNLQVLLLTDTLVLVSRISKVLQPLSFGSQLVLKKMHQEMFYNHLLKERTDIYKHLTNDLVQETVSKKLLKFFRKFKNFEIFEEFDDFSVHTHCCSQCESEFLFEEFQICFHDADKHELACLEKKIGGFEFLTNEQIVDFIEGKIDSQAKRNKRRKKKSKDSAQEFTELDLEVDEFRKRLDCSPASVRSRPCFSKDFIEGLKMRLHIIKRE